MWKTLALSGLISSFSIAAHAAVNVGEPAPDFTGTDTKGVAHTLSDYRGKTVVLEWTNHDCPYVRKHYGSGNMQAQQKAATADGIVWLSIISSAPGNQGHVRPAEADALSASRNASPTSIILDERGDIGRLYDAKTTPHMYIIDKQGTLVYKGGIDSMPTMNPDDIQNAKQYVSVALDELNAGKPITDAVTRPYGCSVKY